MDCLMWIVIGSLFVAVLVLLWRNHRITKEVEVFAEKIEETLDSIVTGKEWNLEEELEDSLWGRMGTQLAKARNVFRKKEEDSFREKERVKGLISDISHQTRTPVANIKLYLELLEDEELSQNGQDFLEKIKGQMEKINFLMQSMVKMSRIETGILQIHREDKNLYETIRHAVADIVQEAVLKRIDLYVNCEENIMICHDSKWTEEAIYNVWIMQSSIPSQVEKSTFRQKDKNYLLRLVFPILEKELLWRGRQKSLQDFTASRKFMINQELGSDYILQEQSWSFRRGI